MKEVLDALRAGYRVALIMRGISGSGKSTLARKILKNAHGERFTAVTVSADSFFESLVVEVKGKIGAACYKFNPAQLGKAHALCLNDFINHTEHDVQLIAVDNTNVERWEYENYRRIALGKGYVVLETPMMGLDVPTDVLAQRNVHGVPAHVIDQQKARYAADQRTTVIWRK